MSSAPHVVIDPTLLPRQPDPRRPVRGHIVFTIGLLLFLAIAWRLRDVLELVYVSALFAVVLMPVIKRIEECQIRGHHPPRFVAIILLVLTGASLLFVLFFFGLPPVVHDMQGFAKDLPKRVPQIVARLKRLPLASKLGIDQLAQRVQVFAASVAGYIIAAAPKWLGHIFDLLTCVILCIYFMLEGESAYFYFLAMVPPQSRARLSKTLLTAEHRMSKWLLGQGSLMLILGVSSTIVYGFLHVRYFFLLGALMGLFNIIPVIGAIITVLLSAAVAAMDSWTKMAGVFIFYAIYAQVENGYLTPRIMRTSVDLMGLTVLIALLAGSSIAGVVGALVSVPTAALIAVLVQEYLVQTDPGSEKLQVKADEYKT